MIYLEDNLILMRTLPDNHIDLIYCDVLYGTGRNFGAFQDIKSDFQTVSRHYLVRFREMKRILKETGLLYIHCDWRIVHHLRRLLDLTFGEENFRNEIIWEYNSAPRKKLDFGKRHDIILRYSKSDVYTFNPIRVPYSETAPRGYEKEKYYHPDGKVIGDVWKISMLGQNDKTERTGYPTQKPEKLLERIILSSSNPGDLVADFYAGSHTTGVVALKNGRKYIGCDSSEEGYQIGIKRL